jgi:hypothetical protein
LFSDDSFPGRGVNCIVSACSDGNPETPPTPVLSGDDVVLASYGSIDYTSATPSIDSGHVLESITCAESAFAMTTSAGVSIGVVDCSTPPPLDVVGRFAGDPITIRITASRLMIEGIGAGTLDMPVARARLEER